MTEFSVRGSNVVVVGAGRSGVGAARLLAGRGARVTLTEMRSDVGEEVERLREVGVDLELGGHRPETLAGADLVVLSPGVPPSLAALERARRARVPVISEIELASRWVRGRVVAVTGTKGKSATTVLLGRMLDDPDRPLVALIGGAKVSSKLDVIHNLVERADTLLIGGAMAYTFFKEMGLPVGQSLVENDLLETARSIMSRVKTRDISFELPVDHVVTFKIDGSGAYQVLEVNDPAIGDRLGVDIGPKTVEHYSRILAGASTVVWNGPMGIFETNVFANGTKGVAHAVAAVRGTTIVAGGDSIAAINRSGVRDYISHISTGGGATLEFLGGRTLPGVAAIPDRLANKSV